LGSVKARDGHGEIITDSALDRPTLAKRLRNQGSIRMASPKSVLAVVAAMIVAGTAAWAQESPMPEEIAWKLLELGRVIDAAKRPRDAIAAAQSYVGGLFDQHRG
jgi:hypothetical protein